MTYKKVIVISAIIIGFLTGCGQVQSQNTVTNSVLQPTQNTSNTQVSVPQPSSNVTYTISDSGEIITLHFHNLGDYSPRKLEVDVAGESGNTDKATLDFGIIEQDNSYGTTAWHIDNNKNIQFWFPNSDFGSNVTIKITCNDSNMNSIVLSLNYKVPQN